MKRSIVVLLFLLAHGAIGADFYQREERVGTGFANPKSIVHDSVKDIYYVSNMNGGLEDKNGIGYISVLKKGEEEYSNDVLFKGGVNNVRLDSPKGMVIIDRNLFVADIDVIRVFDLKASTQLPDIKIPTSKLLYELTANKKKTLYVTDMENNSVYGRQFPYETSPTFYKVNRGLANPSGLSVLDDKGSMWIANYDSDSLIEVSKVKKKQQLRPYRLRTKGIDGITCIGGKDNIKFFMAANPDGKAYLVTVNSKVVIRKAINKEPLKGPSGVCYNPSSKLLLVSEMKGNAVSVFLVSDTDFGAKATIKGEKNKKEDD